MTKRPVSPYERLVPEKTGGFWRSIRRFLSGVLVLSLLAAIIVLFIIPYMVVTVPSGQVGVLWKRFSGPGIYCWCMLARGTVLDPTELRNEGLHLIWPWDKLFLYDLRLQYKSEKYNAISSDGVSVTAEIAIRYQLSHNSAAVLHKYIGPGYLMSLVTPIIGSQTRQVISQFTAERVYVSRQEIEDRIRTAAQTKLGDYLDELVQPESSEQEHAEQYKRDLSNSIRLLDTLVLSIELPEPIVGAINSKTEQQYKITEFRYRAEREAEESKRKQIEANGIAAFQRTVSQGISESYLRWRGIEATLALAQSPNAKIVVIGTGKDGLPIILGNVDSPSVSGQTTKPGSPEPGAPSDRSGSGADGKPSGPSKPPGGGTGEKPGAAPHSPSGSLDKGQGSAASPELSEIKAILARIAEALHATEPETNPGKETKGKDAKGKEKEPEPTAKK